MSDLFTSTEKTNYLFKKNLGLPSCDDTREYFQEPSLPGRSAIFQSQLYAEIIPDVAPADLQALTESSLDDDGQTIVGSTVGRTSTTDPMIRRFFQLPLSHVTGTTNKSYSSTLLQRSIPFNYDVDGSYLTHVYKSSSSELPFGPTGGSWLVDPDAGTVTFYSLPNITGVSESSPPSISFYCYVGQTGGTTANQTIDTITNSENVFLVPQTFDGGDEQTSGDALAALVIDNRDFGTIDTGEVCMAIQLGGDFSNSWRITISKISSDQTSFTLQARKNGQWENKAEFLSG